MYDLTSAEARVFELVYKGLTRAEIAAALRIAASTVKTHMLHLFEKTGSRRQADIIRLGARFSLPA
ncbi:MAG: helix-turn-helix transcriptional regulator [Asticcacaulis sp.]